MKKTRLINITATLLISLGLASTVYSQTLELEVLGGGYKLKGPSSIAFNPVQSTFSGALSSELQFKDLTIEDSDSGEIVSGNLTITDEMGGIRSYNASKAATDAFLVQASATRFARRQVPGPGLADCVLTPKECLPENNFLIKNIDNDLVANNDIITRYGIAADLVITGTGIDTTTFATLAPGQVRTLAIGRGTFPGEWQIFPTLKIIVPEGQIPGEYSSTLTFTII